MTPVTAAPRFGSTRSTGYALAAAGVVAVALLAGVVAVVVARGDGGPGNGSGVLPVASWRSSGGPPDGPGTGGHPAAGDQTGGGPGAAGAPVPPGGAKPGAVSADADARAAEAELTRLVPRTTARYTFDAGPGRVPVDTAGRYALRPVVAGGGVLGFPRNGDGYAVRFPARCGRAPARCPRAILESTRPDLFNSGTRPIRFGAAVLMTPADTGPGANVLQKGFSTGGGTQFKLQVDGAAGRPSCVLANGRAIYRLVAPVSVADGRWHRLACTRVGGRMAIDVDGVSVSRRVPFGLSIRNTEPLRVGGKGVGPGNDQFAGRIDELFISLY